ncbi:uncharacterized protein EV154DRAFT_487703 [Mucor mucedo]|uniref:uncharacterized protein n=1 Tax=Mucor mucedo TaxID=29922 RepID=UPI00221E42CD|nr:uncharacterized protein EV154DRAFT_487703 [Mucor mucedo]KAI7871112.1 hypothetical protein EV154DRAFT_487703 [Mucor mucedo]
MTSLTTKDDKYNCSVSKSRCSVCSREFSSTSNRNRHALKFHNASPPANVGRPSLGGRKQANHRYYKKVTAEKTRPKCAVFLTSAMEESKSLDKSNLVSSYQTSLKQWQLQLQKSRQIMSLPTLNNRQCDSSYWKFLTFALMTHEVRNYELYFEHEVFFNSTSPLSAVYSSNSYTREHMNICQKFWTTPTSKFNCLLKAYCKAFTGYYYTQ